MTTTPRFSFAGPATFKKEKVDELIEATPPTFCAVMQIGAAGRQTHHFVPVRVEDPKLFIAVLLCTAPRLLALSTRFKDDRASFEQIQASNLESVPKLLTDKKSKLKISSSSSLTMLAELEVTACFAGVHYIEDQLCGCNSIHTMETTADIVTLLLPRHSCEAKC
eukprot:6188977-Pleurochrysis_carterae.AAC.1